MIAWTGGDPGGVLLDGGRLKTTLLSFAEALVWWGRAGPIRMGSAVRDDRLVVSAWREAVEGVDVEGLFEARRPGTGGGSKIGLYVAKRVAEAQGGRVWGEVADGRLTLHVELPISGSERRAP